MPFDRLNLSQLRAQVAADINASLPGTDALLRYSNLGITGEVQAGLADALFGYLDWIALQACPFTATDEYLEGWAAAAPGGGVFRKPAVPSSGTATFTGTNGAAIPVGSALNRSDGAAYVTTAAGVIADGAATVAIAAADAGSTGNAAVGTTLYLAVGISGVDAVATVGSEAAGGSDIEPDYQLRSRMLQAYANRPQGGNIDDYGEWALAVPGVTRVWVMAGAMGPGTVVLYFMMDVAEAAHGGFPQGSNGVSTYETRDTAATGDQLTLADALFTEQPVHPVVYAVAPTANTVNLTINGLADTDAGTQAAVEAAFAAALLASGSPGGVTSVSSIEVAIGAVSGTDGFVITAITCSAGSVSPGSAGNITSNAGALPVPGTVTYT